MENLEEVIILVKGLFSDLLRTQINELEDFDDGHLFLEAINKCERVIIPKDKCEKYEAIENKLNKFYDMETNIIVDFEKLAFHSKSNDDDIISLSILIIGMCNSHGYCNSYLDNTRINILLFPIEQHLKFKMGFDQDIIHGVIKKASEKDLDEFSYTQKLSYSSVTDMTDGQRINSKRIVSDDEIENSLNVPSVTSETSYNRFGIINNSSTNFINDSISDIGNHDNSKDSFRHNRRSKSFLNHRKTNTQLHIASPFYRRNPNSPKVLDIRKQDAKRIKNMESDNKYLRDELYNSEMKISKLEGDIQKLNETLDTFKSTNRNLCDEKDIIASKLLEIDQILIRKDKEIEKNKNQLIISKKEKQEKVDEINQLKNNNEELNLKINLLNEKLKLKDNEYDSIKLAEIEFYKINQNLETENKKLKTKVEERDVELQSLRTGAKFINRLEEIQSPIVENVYEGESMNVINEFRLAEIQNEMTCEIEKYRGDVRNLQQNIESKNEVIKELENELRNLEQKYEDAMEEMDKDTEPRTLERRGSDMKDLKSMSVEEIVEFLSETFSGTNLSLEEKKLLINSMEKMLNVIGNDERNNHEMCKNEITSLYKSQIELKQTIAKKMKDYDAFEIEYEELLHSYEKKSKLYDAEKKENENFTYYCKSQKLKSDEDQFKLSRTIVDMKHEKNELSITIRDLKKHIRRCDIDLEKSNQNYVSLRELYDQSLLSLKKITEDCRDYEDLINEINERERVISKNVSCQTECVNNFASTGTNVMSPRTPLRVNSSHNYSNNYHSLMSGPEFINDISFRKNQTNYISNSNYKSNRTFRDNDEYNSNVMPSYKSFNSSKLIYEPKSFGKQYQDSDNKEALHRSYKTPSKINPLLVSHLRKSAKTKEESPLVKKDRINQMLSRNQRQPDHLKSSYPIETQGIEEGYMASTLLDLMKVPLYNNNDTFEEETNRTSRSNTSRRYTNADPLSEFLKCPNKSKVLSSIPVNSFGNVNRNNSFKKPNVPQLNIPLQYHSDRENIMPFQDNRAEDECSIISTSVKFDIFNSPKVKDVGYPRRNIRKEKR